MHKSPLAKDAAKEIWQFECDKKDIAIDVGAKDGSGEQVSDEAEYAAKQYARTIGKYLFNQLRALWRNKDLDQAWRW